MFVVFVRYDKYDKSFYWVFNSREDAIFSIDRYKKDFDIAKNYNFEIMQVEIGKDYII